MNKITKHKDQDKGIKGYIFNGSPIIIVCKMYNPPNYSGISSSNDFVKTSASIQ